MEIIRDLWEDDPQKMVKSFAAKWKATEIGIGTTESLVDSSPEYMAAYAQEIFFDYASYPIKQFTAAWDEGLKNHLPEHGRRFSIVVLRDWIRKYIRTMRIEDPSRQLEDPTARKTIEEQRGVNESWQGDDSEVLDRKKDQLLKAVENSKTEGCEFILLGNAMSDIQDRIGRVIPEDYNRLYRQIMGCEPGKPPKGNDLIVGRNRIKLRQKLITEYFDKGV